MQGELREVPIELCVVDDLFNTRTKGIGDVSELVESIKDSGVLVALMGKDRENPKGEVEIYAGYRRLAAAAIAGLKVVPVMVRKRRAMTRKDMLLDNICENVQRRDLNPVDEARAFYRLQEEYGMSVAEVCTSLGLKKKFVTDRLDLLRLQSVVLKALQAEEISVQAAIEIDRLPQNKQEKFVGIAREFRGAKLKAMVQKELDKIQQKLDGIEKEKSKSPDAAVITEHVRTIKKASSVVCVGLGYSAEEAEAVKSVNYRSLGPDDLGVMAKLLDDCADQVEDDIPINDTAKAELIEAVNSSRGIKGTDEIKSLWVQFLISQAMQKAREINPEKPKVTLALMRDIIGQVFE